MGDCFEEEDSESMDFTSSSEGKEFDGVGRNTGNYSVMPLTAVMDFMKKSLEEVNSVIQLPNLTTLRHLANFYKWDKERLMEVYFEKSPAQLTSLTRLDISGNLKSPFKRKNLALTRRGKTSRREECSICLLEIPSAQLFGLRCEHRFCLACWKHYLRTQILNDGGGGGGGILTCPAHDCRLFVDDDTVLGFIAEELILKGKYLYLVTNQFVNSNRSLIWCPQANKHCSLT
jgi:ariadne-1